MFRLLVGLVLCSMASCESVQDWIAKGSRAYAELKLDESAANFKEAVELDPRSGQARLCYGVISIFLYQNAIAEASAPSNRDAQHTPTQGESDADARRTQVLVSEVNRTLGKQAEENLRRALEIEPHNLVAHEYLAELYFWWQGAEEGNSGGTYPSRLDEAHQACEKITARYPRSKFANYMLGVIDTKLAERLVQRSRYPRPLEDAQARAARRRTFAAGDRGGQRIVTRDRDRSQGFISDEIPHANEIAAGIRCAYRSGSETSKERSGRLGARNSILSRDGIGSVQTELVVQ